MSATPAAPAWDEAHVPATGGVRLSCIERNLDSDGVPVLLVHGLASNARLWDGVAERLAAVGHPVVAVDQRGHGRSEKPGRGYDFETLTADLLAVLSHYGWTADADGGSRRPLVAGQSWGANVVLELAARHPGSALAAGLIDGGTGDLADAFADWPTCEAALAPPPIAGLPAERFESYVRSAHPDWPEEGIAGTLANVEVLPDGTIRPWLSRDDHMLILRHLWEHRPSELFAEVGVPVLVVPAEDGSNQRWMQGKRASVALASELLPTSAVHWIAGDHDLHAQHPEVVAGLLDASTQPGFFT